MHNKTVLITGASSGIGHDTAWRFATEGYRLILVARRLERLQQLADKLHHTFGTKVLPIQLDITDRQAVSETIQGLPMAWRDIDVLINNAGLAAGLEKLACADIQNWERMIDTNVKGLLYMTQAVLQNMLQQAATSKHIVNIGSIAGREVYENGSVYCATKFAVKALTETLRREVCGTKIKVSSVDPGLVETEFSLVRFDSDEQKAKSVYHGMKPLTGEDIANTIYFVVSQPEHVTIADILILPADQASIGRIHRQT